MPLYHCLSETSHYHCLSETEAVDIADGFNCPSCRSQIRAASALVQRGFVVRSYLIDYANRPHVVRGAADRHTRHIIGLEVA